MQQLYHPHQGSAAAMQGCFGTPIRMGLERLHECFGVYSGSVAKYPVALGLRMTVDISSESEWNQIMAMSLVPTLPPIILFFSEQRFFVEGIPTTGMKG